jgi:nitrite reductase (NADH) small subunit/3-phenylpropionate/trans-cinnamate dioxygenase ferredoxin subunit
VRRVRLIVRRRLPVRLPVRVSRSGAVSAELEVHMGEWITVAREGELAPGEGRQIELGEHAVALFNLDGELLAIDGSCPHQGGPLGQGLVGRDGTVTCPWHAWKFAIRDGSSPLDPRLRVRCHAVRIVDGEVQVEMDGEADGSR